MEARKTVRLPDSVTYILKKLEERGHRSYAVGGGVRDTIAGIPPNDWDIATSAMWYQVMEIFPESRVLSQHLSVTHVVITEGDTRFHADVATFRKEKYVTRKGYPDYVIFTGDFSEDVARRDFTINSIAADSEGNIVDVFGGAGDIGRGVLRVIGDGRGRFEEDPLRMLRAARFIGERGYTVHEETMEAIKEKAYLAGEISPVKAGNEIERMADGIYCVQGFRFLEESGLGDRVFDIPYSPEERRETAGIPESWQDENSQWEDRLIDYVKLKVAEAPDEMKEETWCRFETAFLEMDTKKRFRKKFWKEREQMTW